MQPTLIFVLATRAAAQITYSPPVVFDAGPSFTAPAFSVPVYTDYQFASSPPAFSMPAYTEALGAFYGNSAPFVQPQVIGAEPMDPAAVDEQSARYHKELEADLEAELAKLEQDTATQKEALLKSAEFNKVEGKRRIVESVQLQKEGLGRLEQQRLDALRAAARDQVARMEAQAQDLTRQWHERKAQESFRQEQGVIEAKQKAAQANMNTAFAMAGAPDGLGSSGSAALSPSQRKYMDEVDSLSREYQAALHKLQGGMASAGQGDANEKFASQSV